MTTHPRSPVMVAGAFSPTPPGPAPAATSRSTPIVSIAIPAHDEATVIGRCLDALLVSTESPPRRESRGSGHRGEQDPSAELFEITVVCNGCQDDTAATARRHLSRSPSARHRVIELPTASKTAALRAADGILETFPRLYLDADVVVSRRTVLDLVAALHDSRRLAARPPVHQDLTGASRLARRHARARSRIGWIHDQLWGGGVIAVSAEGHRRLGTWPDVVADDLWLASRFSTDEILVVATDPVVVRAPRDLAGLWSVARRSRRGARALSEPHPPVTRTVTQLLASARRAPLDATVYASIATAARMADRRRFRGTTSPHWERDRSSR